MDSQELNNFKQICLQRIRNWVTQENCEKAKGKTFEEIKMIFGNKLEPIAIISKEYLPVLDENIKDNIVYSGFGYMINHIVNHHPEVQLGNYENIQEIIDEAEEVRLDDKHPQRNKSLLFIKKTGTKGGVVIVSYDESETGKILLHKSFFNKTKKGRFDKLQKINLSSVVGNSTISHT